MWKWINSWQVTVLISSWQTHAETVKLWYNRSISKVQAKCHSQLKNMGKSTDCLQFQHLHVYKNQSWVCKDQWIMVMPVHLSKAMHARLFYNIWTGYHNRPKGVSGNDFLASLPWDRWSSQGSSALEEWCIFNTFS